MAINWTSQNKVLPGVYINFKSNKDLGLTVSDRGAVAICEPLSWGPVGEVSKISVGGDVVPYTGYDQTADENLWYREMIKGSNRTAGPHTILLYRPAATSSAKATATIGENLTATAKYPGARGNDISIVITASVDTGGEFTVSTVVDGTIKDSQTAVSIGGLTANDWVDWSGTGDLSATVGVSLSGGADGTVAASAYSDFLTAIEPYSYDVLAYDGSDSSVLTAFSTFVKRVNTTTGANIQLVVAEMTNPDSRFITNVCNGVILSDGNGFSPQQTVWWAAGALAAAKYNESLTFASYPDAVDVSPKLSDTEAEEALSAGKFVFFEDDGVVKVWQDINSLTTYTTEIGKDFHKNRVIRLCNTIANDLYEQFRDSFIGVVNNNEDGRDQFKSAIVGYLQEIQANNGIQNFEADDVTVEAGTDIDAIVVTLYIQPVDATEKVYISINMN